MVYQVAYAVRFQWYILLVANDEVPFKYNLLFVTYFIYVYILTLDFERDSFANGRRNTVRGYAQISTHVEPTHPRDVQHFAVDKIN